MILQGDMHGCAGKIAAANLAHFGVFTKRLHFAPDSVIFNMTLVIFLIFDLSTI